MFRSSIASFVLFCCVPAFGAVVTQTRSIPPTKTDWTQVISFDPFDTSLGTLTGESLFARLHTKSTFEATFTSDSTITLGAGPTSIDFGGLLTLETPLAERSDTGKAGKTRHFPPEVAMVTGEVALPPSPDALTIPATAHSFSSFSSDSGNGLGTVLTDAWFEVKLSREYTPHEVAPPVAVVPEPGSLALMASGLGAAGLVAGWRKFA